MYMASTMREPCGRHFFLVAVVMACMTASFVQSGRAAEDLAGASILQDLRSFREVGTVLHIAAHPDDENTQLITYLARGRGYRMGYLSITRGDGGQNEIGPEFDEKLGVARTQELLAARRLDGGRQFFTRAIDFGFSKTPEETLRFWDKEQVLADVVRVIRMFRPDVLVTRFPVPPGSGGHGHHTASAILAVEAFKVCGDPKAFPEQLAEGLTPWQPKRVFWNGRSLGRGESPSGTGVRVDIGGTDPVTGESFSAIAGRSRAMHKTQGFGNFGGGGGGGGANIQGFTLLAGAPATNDLMDGVDLTWNRISGGAEIGKLADELIAAFKPENASASVPAVLAIRAKLSALPSDPLVEDKRRQLDGILKKCLGLSVETTVATAEVAPGETVKLQHSAKLSSAMPVRWTTVRYPDLNQEVATGITLNANEATHVASQKIPANAKPTQPYWLREEGASGIFRVSDKKLIGLPENPPALPVEFVFEIGGQKLVVNDEPIFTANGGKPTKLAIVSPVALSFGSSVALFKPGGKKDIEVEITAERAAAEGKLSLKMPVNWSVSPEYAPFKLPKAGAKTKVVFSVSAPSKAGSGQITAVAEIGGTAFSYQRTEIRYDHIPVQLLQPPAKLKVVAVDYATRGRNVGYLPGAGDDTVASLQQLGYTVTTLTGADLNSEKLKGLDAVVVGVRAFNERRDLAENLPGLFAFAEQGGTVIVQYNRPNGLRAQKLGPYPLSIAGNAPQWRVTDETVPVTFLAADHAALNVPNKITAADFEGWFQERGAYFPSSFDADHYTPILSMSDPGEAPLKSSLLIAQHGKGHFVYTGLAFFRQLPAGVPGAYRLFANLVSLGK